MPERRYSPRAILRGLAIALFLLVLGSSTALAHAYFYTFPYYPLDTYIGVSDHYHRHWANPGAPYDYFARFDSRVRQTTLGSFDWLSVYTGYGADLDSRGWIGTGYLNGPSGELWRFNSFYCYSVTTYSVLYPDPFIWNPGHEGYWRQENGGGGQCMSAYLTYDNMAVTAVR